MIDSYSSYLANKEKAGLLLVGLRIFWYLALLKRLSFNYCTLLFSTYLRLLFPFSYAEMMDYV
jgi:hypothetical protein